MKAHYTPSEKHPARTMLDFVRLLKRRYQSILSHTGTLVPLDSHGKEILSSLCLGEAFLEKGDLLKRYPTLPTQIAVIGPTQAGKSSVVNLLLGGNFAEISPLAGFTTFPQGFALGLNDLDNLAIEDFFQGYRRIASAERAASPNGVFSLSCVPGEEQPLFGSLVVWDTPDFDSIHSANYYNSLLKAIALADVVLLVVSKDKYADQTVWNILGLIESLRQPMVIVLNKIAPENCSAVIQSFREKWQSSRSDPMPP
ncbi:MAG: GTPase, partial [Gammaproteobacteria bacterium]